MQVVGTVLLLSQGRRLFPVALTAAGGEPRMQVIVPYRRLSFPSVSVKVCPCMQAPLLEHCPLSTRSCNSDCWALCRRLCPARYRG